MKKVICYLCLFLTLTLTIPSSVLAFTVPGVDDEIDEPVVPNVPIEPGTEEEEDDDDDTEVYYPYDEYETYKPKITQLINVNALAYDNGCNVYYMPTLDDLPVKLKNLASNVTTTSGTHKFAVVYDGYYDVDAIMVDTQDGARTTKKIYSASTNTRALNTIGYDLLLSSEKYVMQNVGSEVSIDYYATEVGSKALTYKTVVMDLYKALGIIEYDIQFAYGTDKDFDINESPLLNEISVITTNEGQGVDISELNTYVAVTRTNPDLYWDRFMKDRVQSGDATGGTDVSQSCTTSFVKSANDTLTLGEFASVARALMNLYGEPVVTETERQLFYRAYGAEFPKGTFNSTEIYESVMYLVCKGIIDPAEADFNSPITYSDIDAILSRINDESARLTIKSPNISNATLAAAGYGKTEVAISMDASSYTEYPYATANFYDFLIERNDSSSYYSTSNPYTSTTVFSETAGVVRVSGVTTGAQNVSDDKQLVAGNLKLVNPSNPVKSDGSYNVIEPSSNASNPTTYVYYGVVSYGGKEYYHYKINPAIISNANSLTFTYVYDNSYEKSTSDSDLKPLVIPNASGGIYSNTGAKDSWSHTSFSDANYGVSFKDANSTKTIGSLASNSTVISIIFRTPLTLDAAYSGTIYLPAYSTDTWKWTSLLDNNSGYKYEKLIDINNATNTKAIMFQSSDNETRLEIITNDPDTVKNTDFFKALVSGGSGTSYRTAKGYYRASDGSLLVSYSYLKDCGLVSALTVLSDNAGYVLTLEDMDSNVTLMTGGDVQYVIVGDTFYPNTDGEILVEVTDGDYYISYKACLGWTKSYIVVPTGEEDTVMAMTLDEFATTGFYSILNDTIPIRTHFPSSRLYTMQTSINSGRGDYVHGISMAGSYALAPYTVVMANDNGNDYLFVWHRNNIIDSKGVEHSVSKEDDEAARNMFKKLTGISISKVNDYSLRMFPLNRNHYNLLGNSGDYKGFTFAQIEGVHNGMDVQSATYGWIYTPPEFTSHIDALDAYAASADGKLEDLTMLIPIYEIDRKYFDANVNVCATAAGDPYLPLGTVLGSMCSSTQSDRIGVLQADGSIVYYRPENLMLNSALSEYSLYTAPAAMFAQLKGMGKYTADSISDGSIYFGTSRVTVKNGDVLICNSKVGFDATQEAIRSFHGIGNNSVYVVTTSNTSLGAALTEIETSIAYALENPENLVDWGQFKFERLIKNVDAWSTVLLIFILNILPRVAMLLHFVLMLLSLIKDVKPWKVFNQRVFDVYKFLTFGHQSVDTIDTKRMLIISMVSIAIYYVILDGHLFNFIIFIAKFFIALYQR